MIYRLEQPREAAGLFAGWKETIIWSCLQGVMGQIYGDDRSSPRSAAAALGDFVFLAGEPKEELVRFWPREGAGDFLIMVPQNESWESVIELCLEERARRISRYAFKKEAEQFDREKLRQNIERLGAEFELRPIDEPLFRILKGLEEAACRPRKNGEPCEKGGRELDWCRDFVAQYEDYGSYSAHGMGAVILRDGEIVSGASSYSGYEGGH